MLEVQTVAFYINSLHWRYKLLLFKSTPYTGGTDSCILSHPYATAGTNSRHTIRPVLAGTVLVLRLCPGQSAKKSRLHIKSASIILYVVHQLSLREFVPS